MKKTFVVLILYFIQFNYLGAETNIAFIDMDRIMNSTKPGISMIKQLNVINKKNVSKFNNYAKKLKEQENKLISQKNISTESDFKSNIEKLSLEVKRFNENKRMVNDDFKKLRINSTNELLKLINPILIKFSKDNSISLILNKKNLVVGKTELDITDEIIIMINTEIKEFKIK
jgi:outer membrane protein